MRIITDKKLISVDMVMSIFSTAAWTKNRNIEDVALMINNSNITVLALDGDIPIGFARVVTDFIYRAFIEDVIVIPEYQKSGTGIAIINTIEETLKKFRVPHIELSTIEDSFWKKRGYKIKENTTHMIKYI